MRYVVGPIAEIYDNHFKWWRWWSFNRLNEFIYFIYRFVLLFFLVCTQICIKISFSHTEYFPINQTKPIRPTIWLIEHWTFSEFDYALRLFFYYAIKPQDCFIKWLMKCWHFLTWNSIKTNQNRSRIGSEKKNRILDFFFPIYLLSYLRKWKSIKDVVHLWYRIKAIWWPLLYLFSILWSHTNKVLIIPSSANANSGQQSQLMIDSETNRNIWIGHGWANHNNKRKKKSENWWISCELCQRKRILDKSNSSLFDGQW